MFSRDEVPRTEGSSLEAKYLPRTERYYSVSEVPRREGYSSEAKRFAQRSMSCRELQLGQRKYLLVDRAETQGGA